MASSRDAQDILDLKQTGSSTAKAKKKGPKPKLVRPAHIPKEVWLLETQGDRAPPVALTAVQPKKPKFTRPVKPWEWQTFTHPNRQDGLALRHWARKPVAVEMQTNGPATPAEGATSNAADAKTGSTEPKTESRWARYNVKVDVPKYTTEQYDKYLSSEDWSKEETDYLMALVQNFDLRWIVIADRYEYAPVAAVESNGDDSMALAPAIKTRSMEDLKARYYKVASSMMAVNQPLSSMTPAEFSLHEKMTKFDSTKEARRKRMAEQLLERTDADIEEEKRLLAELKRIVQDEDNFIAERHELYDRLVAPSSRGNFSKYETSAALIELGHTLQVQDRYRTKQHLMQPQRRQIVGVDDKDKLNSPAGPPTAGLQRGSADLRRSIDGNGRKDSKGGQYVPKQLSARDEIKYGVQRPEKLLTGEKIRHLRIERRVTARASSVAAKVQDTMVELGIPIKPVMATEKITSGYESLCSSLDLLLEARRMAEKTSNEIKVLIAQKEAREGKTQEGGEEGAVEQTEEEQKQEEVDVQAKARQKAEAEADAQDAKEAEEAGEAEDAEDDEEEADEDADEQDQEDPDHEQDEDEDQAASEEDENEVAEANSDDEDVGEDEDNGDDDTPVVDGEDENGNAEEEEEESRPSTRNSRKRSLSVLSSAPSQKGNKRQRK